MLIEIAFALLAQVSVPSVTVPPTQERSHVFMHKGDTIIVGAESGKVIVVEAGPAPNPIPDDDDPIPGPVPPSEPYDFAILVVDPSDPAQQPLRTDPSIRDVVKARGATYRSVLSNEEDVSRLGLQQRITENGLPYLVLLKKNPDGMSSKIIGQAGKVDREKILEVVK